MQPPTSLRIVRPVPDSVAAGRASKPLTLEERREVFKGLVVASLDAGFLRYSRRQELLKIAARLGIAEFEACLLIAEAQFGAGELNPMEAEELAQFRESLVPTGLSVSTQITLAILVAAFVDAILIWWLL